MFAIYEKIVRFQNLMAATWKIVVDFFLKKGHLKTRKMQYTNTNTKYISLYNFYILHNILVDNKHFNSIKGNMIKVLVDWRPVYNGPVTLSFLKIYIIRGNV